MKLESTWLPKSHKRLQGESQEARAESGGGGRGGTAGLGSYWKSDREPGGPRPSPCIPFCGFGFF